MNQTLQEQADRSNYIKHLARYIGNCTRPKITQSQVVQKFWYDDQINNITHTKKKCPFFQKSKRERCKKEKEKDVTSGKVGGRERRKRRESCIACCYQFASLWCWYGQPTHFHFHSFDWKLSQRNETVFEFERERECRICVLTELWRLKVKTNL